MKKTNNYNHILLVRTDRIGDVILTTPSISLLRENYPSARISFLTRNYTKPLLEHHRDLDNIIVYDPEQRHKGIRGLFKLAQDLKNQDIDLAILFHPLPALALALFMASIPHRAGTGYRWYSIFFNHRIYEHRKYGLRHELEYNLHLLDKFVEAIPPPEDIQFNFSVDEKIFKLRRMALEKMEVKGNYIIIHPGSGGSAPNLPPEMFARIIQYISDKTNANIILGGNSQEQDLLTEIKHRAGVNKVSMAPGTWNLETYMAVISGSRLFISNSTGPLHIARAYDIPLLGFYCPAIPCSPERWGPYNRLESVIKAPVQPCNTCNINKCPHGNCLSHIPWSIIRTHLDNLIKGL